MNLLAIETSGPVLSVAVKKGKNPARQAHFKGHLRHVENLIPLIDKLLKKERLKIPDIGTFLIGRGPGSFTGLRVGFATLKGFLAVRSRTCFGALSNDLIAQGIKGQLGQNLAVCLNAKRDKLYVRSYRYHKQGWKASGVPAVVSPVEWFGSLAKGTRIAGDGLKAFEKSVPDSLPVEPEKFWHPRASILIELYERKDPFLKRLEKPKECLPFYLRASEAEERLKK